ncbi:MULTISPECIES: hypothetical protein [unclassified Paenibacillus]|uniref:hypothetical protein n=1 Tax=unclassified Paenibacillus TaxID=185978 RepID=UPI0030F6910D
MGKIEKPIIIRQIEADILEVLKTGIDNTGEVSLRLNKKYSSIHNVLGRMVMCDLVNKPSKGVYKPSIIDSYEVASDKEVTDIRRNKDSRYKDLASVSEDMLEILEYIRHQLKRGVNSRSMIYKKLRSQGLNLSKFEYNELITNYKLAPRRRNTEEKQEISEIS